MWAARAIVWGFNLGADAGFDLLQQFYNPSCEPPWSDAELLHKCEGADCIEFDKPRGYLLNGPTDLSQHSTLNSTDSQVLSVDSTGQQDGVSQGPGGDPLQLLSVDL